MVPVLRVDLVYLFLAAVVTVFLIKLTSLLPASLYFNFSSSFSSDMGAFLIPRPVLEARQQCELARAKGFAFKPCPTDETVDLLDDEQRKLLAQAVIEVQSMHMQGGSVVLDSFQNPRDLAELTDEIESELGYRDSLADFRDIRLRTVAGSVSGGFVQAISDRFDVLVPSQQATEDFQAENDGGQPVEDVAVDGEESGGPPGTGDPGVDMDGAPGTEDIGPADAMNDETDPALASASQKLARAENSLLAGLQRNHVAIQAATLPEIEKLLAGSSYIWAAREAVDNYFAGRVADALRPAFEDSIRSAGLDIDRTKSEMERAVIAQTGWQYALALLIRLATPFAAAALLAMVAGAGMRLSIAVGCAFSAFVLAWPVVLLWNGVVEASYRDLRGIFIAFYIAYVASFFTLGWFGATVGAILHQQFRIPYSRQMDESPHLAGVRALARQIPFQVLLNFLTNGVTLALSFVFFGGDVGYIR